MRTHQTNATPGKETERMGTLRVDVATTTHKLRVRDPRHRCIQKGYSVVGSCKPQATQLESHALVISNTLARFPPTTMSIGCGFGKQKNICLRLSVHSGVACVETCESRSNTDMKSNVWGFWHTGSFFLSRPGYVCFLCGGNGLEILFLQITDAPRCVAVGDIVNGRHHVFEIMFSKFRNPQLCVPRLARFREKEPAEKDKELTLTPKP